MTIVLLFSSPPPTTMKFYCCFALRECFLGCEGPVLLYLHFKGVCLYLCDGSSTYLSTKLTRK